VKKDGKKNEEGTKGKEREIKRKRRKGK